MVKLIVLHLVLIGGKDIIESIVVFQGLDCLVYNGLDKKYLNLTDSSFLLFDAFTILL